MHKLISFIMIIIFFKIKTKIKQNSLAIRILHFMFIAASCADNWKCVGCQQDATHCNRHSHIHTRMHMQRVTCNGNNNNNKKSVIGFAKRRQSTPTFLPLLNISKKGEKKARITRIHTYIHTYAHTYIYTYIAQNTVVNGAGDRKEIMCIYVVAY